VAAHVAAHVAARAASRAAARAASRAAARAASPAAAHAASISLMVALPRANRSATSSAAIDLGSVIKYWTCLADHTANSRSSESVRTPSRVAIQITHSGFADFHASSIVSQFFNAHFRPLAQAACLWQNSWMESVFMFPENAHSFVDCKNYFLKIESIF
jgi:hypothetical protein